MSSTQSRRPWGQIARRLRVPLGFVTAGVFLVFAQPSARSLLWSLPVVLPGLALRAYAAGYVKKNAELTRTGPYAHTRNPLYLGSMLIAFGFAVAAGRIWLGLLLVVLFLAIYWPTILSEETYLRSTFPDFDAYAAAVPRLLPRLTPARFSAQTERFSEQTGTGGREASLGLRRFSPERYRHHREYNSLMGAGALYAALLLRLWWMHRAS